MTTLHLMATTYQRRPSEIVGIRDEWAAYQFDAAVMVVGLEAQSKGGRRRSSGSLPDPQALGGDWAALAQL